LDVFLGSNFLSFGGLQRLISTGGMDTMTWLAIDFEDFIKTISVVDDLCSMLQIGSQSSSIL
jgi:hypothetical protein